MSASGEQPIAQRANRVLNIVLVAMLLIAIRVWHLAVIQHDARREGAMRPQRRSVTIAPLRGTIRDRFNLPLAVNRIQYDAVVHYDQIKELPIVRQRRHLRKDHVTALSQLLADELDLDPERIEDEIYSYAALFPNVPHVIKANISEQQYFRLKMLEKDWIGLQAQERAVRHYPRGLSASHLLGHLGAINRREYETIIEEIQELTHFFTQREEGRSAPLPEGCDSVREASERLNQLRQRAYSLRDLTGKDGVEGQLEEVLRGFSGKQLYASDIFGNFVRELPGERPSLSGQRVVLNICAELQEFAERLLIENERIRDGRSHCYDAETRSFIPLKQPWIKGGAIVAMEPESGEILALAGYPRYDPNDFVRRDSFRINEWFETEAHLGAIWDGKVPMRREVIIDGRVEFEELDLTWERYLDFILACDGQVRQALEKVDTVAKAVRVQRSEELPLELTSNEERHLILDLCGLCVDERFFTPELLEAVGDLKLGEYRAANRAFLRLSTSLQRLLREQFHHHSFRVWREKEGQSFLAKKRKEEREKGNYQRPFLDYFDEEEKKQFSLLWGSQGDNLLLLLLGKEVTLPAELLPYASYLRIWRSELEQGAHNQLPWYAAYQQVKSFLLELTPSIASQFLASMRSFHELNRPLRSTYRNLRWGPHGQTEKELAAAFYARFGYGYARSWAYRQAAPQGSVFKIVTSYAALMRRFAQLSASGKGNGMLNPLVIVDDPHRVERRSGWNVGYSEAGEPISEHYKGGQLLRTHRRNVGTIDLPGALEVSSNAYFGLLAADHLNDPEDLNESAASLSYGSRTGLDLPHEYGGHLPEDLSWNQTGLYTYACGQHSLVVTPVQTACMLSTIANGGRRPQPQVVRMVIGDEPVYDPAQLLSVPVYPFQASLNLLGIQFPLWSRLALPQQRQVIQPSSSRLLESQPIPAPVRDLLLDGLWRSVCGSRGGSRPSVVRAYQDHPWMVRDFVELAGQLIGKTGTAEIREALDLDPGRGAQMYNHIWFAGISFESQEARSLACAKPELVVVILLRFGDYGREAGPVAAQVVKKWREIKARRAS
jgi:cell division protein FtsI/penicillin-binding protein 2